ncbi:MAG: AsnC family transcriptional regulator [Thaumarchaeota archaeon]|nr:AsnC family transcriptional regulator [Nitrososphaerota archaeon]
MPIVLDKIDMSLINAMLEDGRRSYRQLARIANVSTPTAEARIKRMINSGFLKKIVPVFDAAKVEHGVSAIVYLKVDPHLVNEISSYLQSLEQIRNVFLTTGEWNMIIRIACSSNEELQSIMDDKIVRQGITIVNSQVITRTMKDEQGFIVSPDIRIGLTCDYCGGDIKGNPFKLKVGEGERYFCCKTCMNSYKEKYGARISKLNNNI